MKCLILALAIMSSAAFACPNLTGNFNCKLGSRVFDIQIENNEKGYHFITAGVEMDYITDGQGYEIPSTENYKDAIVKSSCEGNAFIVNFTASILYEGSVIAHEVSKTEYSLNGDNLSMIQKTKMKGIPLPTNKFNCIRY
jgi:hypothetical protein